MRILHLAAGNRWTGAAAPAFAEVEALRAAGADAHYVYVGGYKLQEKIGHHDYAHALIDDAQNPISFSRSVERIERLVLRHSFDFIHAHLSWDHWLARFVARGRSIRVARTIHARRVLRRDPFTRSLFRSTDRFFVVNAAFAGAAALRDRTVTFTPPPIDTALFHPEGPDVRALHGIAPETKLVTVIGKLSPGRGFEEAIRTFAALRSLQPGARLMIIGHGDHRWALEQLARSLGIGEEVLWAGYHEQDLPEHYRASDLLLFTARGSDEGHRAVLEALACGVPAVSLPVEGVDSLIGPERIAAEHTPESLAALAASVLALDPIPLRLAAWERARQFDYAHAAKRLLDGYGTE